MAARRARAAPADPFKMGSMSTDPETKLARKEATAAALLEAGADRASAGYNELAHRANSQLGVFYKEHRQSHKKLRATLLRSCTKHEAFWAHDPRDRANKIDLAAGLTRRNQPDAMALARELACHS